MHDEIYQHAEEMMRQHQAGGTNSMSPDAKLWRLNNQLSITASRCLSQDYCPVVSTQKRGIAGKMVILAKRFARKATFFIVRDLTQEISAFQRELLNTLGGMIELQEEIMIELMSMKNSASVTGSNTDASAFEQPKGDLR